MRNRIPPRRIILICVLSFIGLSAMAQDGKVGIGTTTPDNSSILEIRSTSKGVLVPRLTTAQKNVLASPATGLLIYQTDSVPGFYYYQAGWQRLTASLAGYADTALSNLTTPTAISVDLNPATTGTNDLGSVASAWKNGYFNGSIFIEGARFLSRKGANNSFVGTSAGNTTLTGDFNTGVGSRALLVNTTGSGNTATGADALPANSSGSYNTAHGVQALNKNVSSSSSTAIGAYALYNSTGGQNTASGANALYSNTSGYYNTASGYQSSYSNTTGVYNTTAGAFSLFSNTTGNYNVGIGQYSLYYNATTSENTAIGYSAGDYTYTSSQATFLGSQARASNGLSNITAVGYGANVTASNSVRIGNTSVTSIGGQVGWTSFSDGRFKKNIKEDVPGLEFINKLHPVTYNLDIEGIDKNLKTPLIQQRSDNTQREVAKQTQAEISAREEKSKIKYTGFIAQDVEEAAKKMSYDFSGVDAPKNSKDFYGIRYSDFVVPLVKAVQELSKKTDEIAELKREVTELKAMVAKLAEKNP